jgi:hypothetical protein
VIVYFPKDLGVEAAFVPQADSLEIKRAAAKRYLGRNWVLHPRSVFVPSHGPKVLK